MPVNAALTPPSGDVHALPLLVAALCVLALAYRFYSKFLATRVMGLDDSRPTAAVRLADGQNFHPTGGLVLFGHHFAAISGAGPLIGPVIACQFGWAPTYLWLLVGVVLAGAVQDFVVLVASARRDGKSLAEIARQELGPVGGTVTAIAILFIVIIALAGLGSAVKNALAESRWGVFTIACTIPIAFGMGLYTYKLRRGAKTATAEASVIGVALLLAAVWGGQYAQSQPWGAALALTEGQIVWAMMAYGFVASVLPVWLLLCPRDYLSSFLKIGTIGALVAGVLIVNPVLKAPALSEFAKTGLGPVGGGGTVFPMVFIVVMCGAISGFHALVSSGTTPKMLSKESHARPIGYGAMLIECLVGIVALIAVASLEPADYYLMNTPAAKVAKYNFQAVALPDIEHAVGERLQGKIGGAPTLAVGIATILAKTPVFALGGDRAVSLWYHFAIMFEALFILTTIDTGTRIARFLLGESMGRWLPGGVGRRFADHAWKPGTLLTSAAVVGLWGALLLNGSIDSIWPMFGIANQMLAAIALAVATTLIIRAGRARYCWTTLVPMTWVFFTTTAGGGYLISTRFLPWARGAAGPDRIVMGWLNTGLIAVMMACAAVIVVECARRSLAALRAGVPDSAPGT